VTPPREPVRPSTRVTLTSLTGCLEESIVATVGKLVDWAVVAGVSCRLTLVWDNETGVPKGRCAAPGQCPNTRRARLSMHRPSVVDRLPRTPCSPECTFIVVVGPHARTRGGRGCRPHGLGP
jgi:hypothetical protein